MTTAPCATCGYEVLADAWHCSCGAHPREGRDCLYCAQVPATHTERLSGPQEKPRNSASEILKRMPVIDDPAVSEAMAAVRKEPPEDTNMEALPPGYESWVKEMQGLLQASNHVHWDIGDRMLYGEDAFGEDAWDVVDPAVHPASTVHVDVWVCRKVPPHVRLRDQLSFEHHKAVASLEPEAQARLLRQAADGGWPVTALRAEVRELKGREEAPKRRCDRCGKEHTCIQEEE